MLGDDLDAKATPDVDGGFDAGCHRLGAVTVLGARAKDHEATGTAVDGPGPGS